MGFTFVALLSFLSDFLAVMFRLLSFCLLGKAFETLYAFVVKEGRPLRRFPMGLVRRVAGAKAIGV